MKNARMPGSKKHHIFISAAEPSADLHCAALIRAISERTDEVGFVGVGGAEMAAVGCELLAETARSAAMIYNAFGRVAYFYRLLRRVRRYFEANHVDLVIVCDSPAFNMHVAAAAKKAGIRTLFYVAPQLWAWGGWRIGKLRKYCDRLCCILPFEPDWFRRRGLENSVFVGHPMLDGLPGEPTGFKRDYADFDADRSCLALLPGSRQAEIKTLWRPMQQIALDLQRRYRAASFVAVAVDQRRRELLAANQLPGFECDYIVGDVFEAARRADFAIVASGSATLQVASAGCPMVVMYQCSKILWHLVGRWIVRGRYLSLVNVLAGRELVPEFMPYFKSIREVTAVIEELLNDSRRLARMSAELIELVGPLHTTGASEKVAEIALEMMTSAESQAGAR